MPVQIPQCPEGDESIPPVYKEAGKLILFSTDVESEDMEKAFQWYNTHIIPFNRGLKTGCFPCRIMVHRALRDAQRKMRQIEAYLQKVPRGT